MNIRFYVDPEAGMPHIYRHDVSESEVEEVLLRPGEDRPGQEGSRVQWPHFRREIHEGNLCTGPGAEQRFFNYGLYTSW